jgi:hypothetical protein
MDDRKAIELMADYFYAMFKPAVTEPDRKKLYFNGQKVMSKFVEWYNKARSGEGHYGGVDGQGFPIVKDIPSTTGDKDLAEYETGMMAILRDFNSRNINGEVVMEYFDSYLNQGKYGFDKRNSELAKM